MFPIVAPEASIAFFTIFAAVEKALSRLLSMLWSETVSCCRSLSSMSSAYWMLFCAFMAFSRVIRLSSVTVMVRPYLATV